MFQPFQADASFRQPQQPDWELDNAQAAIAQRVNATSRRAGKRANDARAMALKGVVFTNES